MLVSARETVGWLNPNALAIWEPDCAPKASWRLSAGACEDMMNENMNNKSKVKFNCITLKSQYISTSYTKNNVNMNIKMNNKPSNHLGLHPSQ
jgi:hypothetical protein